MNPLIIAAVAHCDQQERRAHAEFFFHMTAFNQEKLQQPGARPWRGIMQPSLLHLINVLEEMGEYEDVGLAIPANVA